VDGAAGVGRADRRPVWLLDVDGVINAIGRVGWDGPPRIGRAHDGASAYAMQWAPQLIAGIRALLPRVDVRWASSWIDVGTDQLETLFGLPPLPVAYPADPERRVFPALFAAAHARAKTDAAVDVVRAGRRLIWTDDDAIPAAGADRALLDAAGSLLIVPDRRHGMLPEHLERIRDYVTG